MADRGGSVTVTCPTCGARVNLRTNECACTRLRAEHPWCAICSQHHDPKDHCLIAPLRTLRHLAERCIAPFRDGEDRPYTRDEALFDLEQWLRSNPKVGTDPRTQHKTSTEERSDG